MLCTALRMCSFRPGSGGPGALETCQSQDTSLTALVTPGKTGRRGAARLKTRDDYCRRVSVVLSAVVEGMGTPQAVS